MKLIILASGRGRRMGALTLRNHKGLIPLGPKSSLEHLASYGLAHPDTELIVTTGHARDRVEQHLRDLIPLHVRVTFVYNRSFATSNNLRSLFEARDYLDGSDFVLVNGDTLLRHSMINEISKTPTDAVATCGQDLGTFDAPVARIENGRVVEVGRHLTPGSTDGWAVGLYRFTASTSGFFFEHAEALLQANPQAGFYDPLSAISKMCIFQPFQVKTLDWMDIDCVRDLSFGRVLMSKFYEDDENWASQIGTP